MWCIILLDVNLTVISERNEYDEQSIQFFGGALDASA